MEDRILSPIGLVVGIIAAPIDNIKAKLIFGFERRFVKQDCFYKKIHSPIQGRSPPLFACRFKNLLY